MRQNLISTQCYCVKPEIVFLPFENETVCKTCGVVLENKSSYNIEQTVPYEMLCKTNLNLHQRKQVGGDPRDEQMITSTKFHTESDSLLAFSDVCRKLSLTSAISEDSWKLFYHDATNLTKAKKMCHAIYQTLQNNAIPYDENIVQNIICCSLGVKNASGFRGIIFKTDSSAFTSKEVKMRFYLNLSIKQAQNQYNISDVSALQKNSRYYMDILTESFPNSDYKTLAKKATEMARLRCLN